MRGSGAFRTSVTPGGALTGPWVRNPLWRNARAVPSLDLQFADNKSLVDAVTNQNLVTFTRASSGTFVGSDGLIKTAAADVPRFDHNPTTGESLGLLVEEQRTNLVLRSEEFDNAVWTLFGTASRTANATVAPSGATTADSVTLPISSGIFQLANGSAGTTYTFSVWIRCNTTQSVRMVINTNLADPTLLTVTATSSWQRFSLSKTTSVGTLTVGAQVDTGGGNTFFIWGAQLEAGAFPTSYIPTTTAAATRAADVAQITGTNFSSWYRQDEGTVFYDGTVAANQFATYVSIDNGIATQNSTYLDNDSSNMRAVTWSSGVAVSVLALSAVGTAGIPNKLSSTYKVNDFGAVRNAGIVQVDASGAVPVSSTQLSLGRAPSGLAVTYINGTIKRLTFWPQRLQNSTLQAITQP